MNPFILNDVADCPPTFAPQSYFQANRILSLAVLPIMIRQELVGTLTLHQCQASRVWVADDIDLLRDIAEHLGVALQQAEIVRELEHRKQVLEHTLDELRQAQVHLVQSEKMAVLGQFVAGIAHEVNTPLGAMMSNTETIRNCVDRLQADPPVERRKVLLDSMESLLGINKMAGERIQEIVRNLRNFARLDESDLKEVDVHEGIDSVLLLMRSTLPPEITVSKDYEPRMPRVQCYPGLLNQVFMNLLVNAMHAVENRPKPSIGIKTEYLKDTNAIRTAISDNGIGIPPENLARIFDPGFTTKRGGVGTGLGLALCYKILDKHHGRIHVESTVGAGTTFFVELPVRQTS
jgi:signal transduction histidine kinase